MPIGRIWTGQDQPKTAELGGVRALDALRKTLHFWQIPCSKLNLPRRGRD
jgi:hypothetical protein